MLLNLSRKHRESKNLIFNFLKFIPDESYLKLLYFIRMKKILNLKNPKTFNEKLQWLKLNDRKSQYSLMVDKYEAKKYVQSLIGEQYIIPTYGVWNSFNEIDFNSLPNKFVLKCTHDSGGVVICQDKKLLNIELAKQKINKSLKCNFYYVGREWPYKNVKPRIIAEKYLEDKSTSDLKDYKFYCFNGEPLFLYLSQGMNNHQTARISYVNLDWTLAKYKRSDYLSFTELPQKPKNLNKMIELSRSLAKDIKFLRVDFYEVNGQIYFGELTFYPGSGFTPFASYQDDLDIGNYLKLDI